MKVRIILCRDLEADQEEAASVAVATEADLAEVAAVADLAEAVAEADLAAALEVITITTVQEDRISVGVGAGVPDAPITVALGALWALSCFPFSF